MMTSLFVLLVNQLRGSSLRLLHWLKTSHIQIINISVTNCRYVLGEMQHYVVLTCILLLGKCSELCARRSPLSFFDLLLEGTCFFFKV